MKRTILLYGLIIGSIIACTFLVPSSVGPVVALVAAGTLRRKTPA